MSLDGPDRRLPLLLASILFLVLAGVFFAHLGESGLLGPDEPRYASIGRAMAESGDWVTPALNGRPWYEKPPLLYWLVGFGFLAGLDQDTAPRAPVAFFSLFSLALWVWVISRIESAALAFTSLAVLSTTAGWASLSMVAVTDLPLAASFMLALGFGVLARDTGSRPAAAAAGIWLGLAVLAKGLVPIVLLLPFLFWARSGGRLLVVLCSAAAAVAAPWYLMMTARHGWAFIDVFFLQHHFGRFASEALQHVRSVWFYIPVALAGLFPWSPLAVLLNSALWREPRNRIWFWTAATGFVFFSLSTNKLPAYLLPLFPSCSILLARPLLGARTAARALAVCGFLLALAPAIASLLPEALLHGLSRARVSEVHWEYFAIVAPAVIAVYLLERSGRRLLAIGLLSLSTLGALLFVKLSAAPVLAEVVSARGLARRVADKRNQTCVEGLHRNYRYGLDYYLRVELPECDSAPASRFAIVQEPGRLPRITPR